MTDDKPVERPVDQIIQERKDRRRDRRIVASALSLAFLSVLAVAGIALVFAITRGKDVTDLSTGLDAQRAQTEYCAKPTTPKNDPHCKTPVAPPASAIVGKQGVQGIQGVPGQNGKDGRDGKDGITPPCMLQANRCVGARGLQGIPGIQGVQGIQGEQGIPGKNGKDGLTPPCMQTEAQCQGADGKDGKDGTNGTNGTDGQPGQPGKDGTNGTDGRGVVSARCGPDSHLLEFAYTDAPDTWVPVQGFSCSTTTPTPTPPPTSTGLLKTR